MKHLSILGDFHMRILKSLSKEEIFHAVVDTAFELTDCEGCSVLTLQGDWFRSRWGRGSSSLILKNLPLDQALNFIGGTVNIEDLRRSSSISLDHGRSFASAPFSVRDRIYGLLTVSHSRERAFGEKHLRELNYLANLSTFALERIEMIQEIQVSLRKEKKAREEVQRMNLGLETVNEVGNLIGSTLKLEDLLKGVVYTIRKRLNYKNVAILLLGDGKSRETPPLVIRAYVGYWGENLVKYEEAINKRSISKKVVLTGNPILIEDVRKEPHYVGDRTRKKSEIAVPLKWRERILGVLDVEREEVRSLGKKDLRLLSILASRIAIAIENAHLYEETERLANTDEITGLYNFRYLKTQLESSEKRGIECPLSLLMLDLDNFKRYNDKFGHPAGDRLLRELAGLLRKEVKEEGLVARYGGDEFLILLFRTLKCDARVFSEKLLKTVEKHLKGKRMTVSIGYASFPRDVKRGRELIDAVDRALYRAKERGKNRVCS